MHKKEKTSAAPPERERGGVTKEEGRWEGAGLGQAPGEHPPTVALHARRRGGDERSIGVRGLACVMSGVE